MVGSGAGGSPLAARLALAGHSVLLIEAGDDRGEDIQTTVPATHILSSEYPAISWEFYVNHHSDPTEAKRDSKMNYRLTNGSIYTGSNPPADAKMLGIWYPRAATLGGCAMHNGGVCSLPADSDFDIIVSKTGDKSWEAAQMRKYLVKIEKNTYLPKGTPGHGFDGKHQSHGRTRETASP